jgi:hypothetical protein
VDRSETHRILSAAATFSPSIPADSEQALNMWHLVIGDLPYAPASRAVIAHYRESQYPITPADIVRRVKASMPDAVPFHLRCPDHPDPRYRAAQCPQCVRQIAPPAPEVLARVKEIAASLDLKGKQREQERLEALQRRADEGAARVAAAQEKQRQLDAWRAREAEE